MLDETLVVLLLSFVLLLLAVELLVTLSHDVYVSYEDTRYTRSKCGNVVGSAGIEMGGRLEMMMATTYSYIVVLLHLK